MKLDGNSKLEALRMPKYGCLQASLCARKRDHAAVIPHRSDIPPMEVLDNMVHTIEPPEEVLGDDELDRVECVFGDCGPSIAILPSIDEKGSDPEITSESESSSSTGSSSSDSTSSLSSTSS